MIPTMSNRKELERVALSMKWVNRRNKLDQYLEDNPNCLHNYMLYCGSETMNLESTFPTFMKHPNGSICYERYSLSTDATYHKGMKVIVDLHTEEVYMKHFDNVVYNAMQKGYVTMQGESALKAVKRNIKLDKLFA